jgi:hypothetical protein
VGFLDFWLKRNITAADESAIRRSVRNGLLDAEGARRDSNLEQIERDMHYFKEHRTEILEANEYTRSFKRANAEISKAFGWMPFSPLDEPQRMTPEQCQKALEILDSLDTAGVIPRRHVEKIREYLLNARPDIQT